jgi:hypothetical protein
MNIDQLKEINEFKFDNKIFFICLKKNDFPQKEVDFEKIQSCMNTFYEWKEKIENKE